MKIFVLLPMLELFLMVQIDLNDAFILKSNWQRYTRNAPKPEFQKTESVIEQLTSGADNIHISPNPTIIVNEDNFDYEYWNTHLGNNKSIKIEYGKENEIIPYWMSGQPLKVITHGWAGREGNDNGWFSIKIAYVKTTNYNVITVDWSRIADNVIYPIPESLTPKVGSSVAKFLENVVKLGLVDPSHIHLLGHSLGAQVFAATGRTFNLGKIGRITGLDPAGPGYENVLSIHLKAGDAQFVDVIHTAAGTFGYAQPVGDVDFYANGGRRTPQPGCLVNISPIICSHFRSYELYTDSIYYRNSLIGVMCPSWIIFLSGLCNCNPKSPIGEDCDPKARGVYYLKTKASSPYGISNNTKIVNTL